MNIVFSVAIFLSLMLLFQSSQDSLPIVNCQEEKHWGSDD